MRPTPLVVIALALLLVARTAFADVPEGPPTGDRSALLGAASGGTGGAGPASNVAPDLFTGSFTTEIPIDLPPGPGRATPRIALRYTAGAGNGFVGVGWELELGAIERSTRRGVDYGRDAYVLRLNGASMDLVRTTGASGTEYRAKYESAFLRVVRSGEAWIATDPAGTRYFFGQTVLTRQENPSNTSQVFRWCLDRVEDVHGNFWTATYYEIGGGIYPDTVYYGWLDEPYGERPNRVRFVSETGRPDTVESSAPGFRVSTALRLKAISVRSAKGLVAAHRLHYGVSATGRSWLERVVRFGADAFATAVDGEYTGPSQTLRTFAAATGQPFGAAYVGGPPAPGAPAVIGDSVYGSSLMRTFHGDFNGDGRTDTMYVPGSGGEPPAQVYLSTATGYSASPLQGPPLWVYSGEDGAKTDLQRVKLGDFNGDGRTDILQVVGWDDDPALPSKVFLANSNGSFPQVRSFEGPAFYVRDNNDRGPADLARIRVADFTGDGRADLLHIGGYDSPTTLTVYPSNGTGFASPIPGPSGLIGFGQTVNEHMISVSRIKLGDFNGNGRMDIAIVYGSDSAARVRIFEVEAGGAAIVFRFEGPDHWVGKSEERAALDVGRIFTGDFNADGCADFAALADTSTPVWLSRCTSIDASPTFHGPLMDGGELKGERVRVGDFDGDGRSDIVVLQKATVSWPSPVWNPLKVFFARANSFSQVTGFVASPRSERLATGDFNGDGVADLAYNANLSASPASVRWYLSSGTPGDRIATLQNEYGGTIALTYRSSTEWGNTRLPVPVWTLSSVTVNDARGNGARTDYSYSQGYLHIGEREFRGFASATVTGPATAEGARLVTQTFFHQGSGTSAAPDSPDVVEARTKGKPYRVLVFEDPSRRLLETTTAYRPDVDGVAPWFTPPSSVSKVACNWRYDEWWGWLETCMPGMQVTYGYDTHAAYPDGFGNVVREERHGDYGWSQYFTTVIRTFSPNVGPWILRAPSSETVYRGAGVAAPAETDKLAQTTFTYDGTVEPTECLNSGDSSTPTRGDLATVARWLNGQPATTVTARYGHEGGDLICERDPDGNVTTHHYANGLLSESVRPLGEYTRYTYYGFATGEGVPLGLVKSVEVPAGISSYQYDGFGRPTSEILPDGSAVNRAYSTGLPLTITTSSPVGTWEEATLDGLGRPYWLRSRATPSGRRIARVTKYAANGQVAAESDPYFDTTGSYPAESGLTWARLLTHDVLGRPTQVATRDFSGFTQCYLDGQGWTIRVEGEGRVKRETRDALGQVTRIELLGQLDDPCLVDLSAATPLSSTTYQYDRLGNPTAVIDAAGSRVEVGYDTLGRRRYLSDPDLGTEYYTYTPGGDLETRRDGSGALLASYEYDALHRLTKIDYPVTEDVVHEYGGASDGTGRGRLKKIRGATGDVEGTVSFTYDGLGRIASRGVIVNGAWRTTAFGHDTRGRPATVTYPDGAVVTTEYDADGFARRVFSPDVDYATFTDYDALGRPGLVTFGNEATTSYTYVNDTSKPARITTRGPGGGSALLDLSYVWSGDGSPRRIEDLADATRTQQLSYDWDNRLTWQSAARYGNVGFGYALTGNLTIKSPVSFTHDPIRVHQIRSGSDGSTYDHDAKGNLTREVLASGASRNFVYDDENRLIAVEGASGERSATLGYDLTGERIKSDGSYGTYWYMGPHYRCRGASCNRYVFLGSTLLAAQTPAGLYYYHPDHLGSTRVVTNEYGSEAERLEYAPYGDYREDTGMRGFAEHRFTGQVIDPSTGLYYYNARFYHPRIGRFLTPDSFVQDPFDAQSLNRYAYARGNPATYTDPSGHFFLMGPLLAIVMGPVNIIANGIEATYSGGLNITNGSARRDAWREFGRDVRKEIRQLDPTAQDSRLHNSLQVEGEFWKGLATHPWTAFEDYYGYQLASVGAGSGLVTDVSYYRGALVLDWTHPPPRFLRKGHNVGITLGSYVNVTDRHQEDLVRHEYGHVLQSRMIGPLYLPFVAIPSFVSAVMPGNNHNTYWTEVWANRLGKPGDQDEYPRRYDSRWWKSPVTP